MTSIHKRVLLTVIAAFLCVFSVVLWTMVVGRTMRVYSIPASVTADHPAASLPEGDDDHGEPLSGEEVLFAEEEAQDTTAVSSLEMKGTQEPNVQRLELKQWGLSKRYELSIPSISLHASVYVPDRRYWDAQQWDLLEQQMQVGLLHGAAAYPHSVLPGGAGAVIIAGHSSPPNAQARLSAFGTLFARLPDLSVGDTVALLREGQTITYRVTGRSVVEATATEVLSQPDSGSMLKLITCYPIGTDAKRLIVTAELVEG
ncbi:MAG: sortase [Candidatus Peribacteraceae bacterium]|nr:sortase [Candidatus Peribacteraceae bacterium]